MIHNYVTMPSGDPVPYAFAINKCDELETPEETKSYAFETRDYSYLATRDYSYIKLDSLKKSNNVFQISCKTGHNIKEIFSYLLNEIKKNHKSIVLYSNSQISADDMYMYGKLDRDTP